MAVWDTVTRALATILTEVTGGTTHTHMGATIRTEGTTDTITVTITVTITDLTLTAADTILTLATAIGLGTIATKEAVR